MRTEDLIALWLHGRSPATQDAYRRDVKQFLKHAGAEIAEISLEDVQHFSTSISHLKPASRARKLAAVKSFFSFASSEGHLRADPARRVRLPKVKDTLSERIISEGETTRIIYLEESPRNRLILRLLYKGAFRVSELCGIKARDVQEQTEDQGQVTVFGKGGKTRNVVIDGEAWHELRTAARELSPDDSLFGLSRHQVYRVVRAAAEKAGVRRPEGKGKNVSPHWMRHAHVSHALDRGAPAHLVQSTAGHGSLATTTRYAHARPNESSGRYLSV